MNYSSYLARRLSAGKQGSVTRPVVRVSVFSIALSVLVMLIAFAIVRGFQHEVREKIIGFGSHIQIRPFSTNNSVEQYPISVDRDDIALLSEIKNIKSVYPFVEKGALIRTDSNIHGVVMKGVGIDFDFTFLKKNLYKGRLPYFADTISNDVLISQKVATMLSLDIGSPLRVYFILPNEVQPRGRRFNVCGIFNTGMGEFDNVFSMCDMRQLQKLNRWGDSLVSGYEIIIDKFDNLPQVTKEVNSKIYYDLRALEITKRSPQLFDWLSLLDSNVLIIIILMTIVAIINIISIILILILERISFIGFLKAIGAGNRFIRSVFIKISLKLLFLGVLFGNVIGISLILLQQHLHIFPLNEDMYYLDHIPALMQFDYWLGINVGVFAVSLITILIPALIIKRIMPSMALKHK